MSIGIFRERKIPIFCGKMRKRPLTGILGRSITSMRGRRMCCTLQKNRVLPIKIAVEICSRKLLVQGAAESYVNDLDALADTKHWLLMTDASLQCLEL